MHKSQAPPRSFESENQLGGPGAEIHGISKDQVALILAKVWGQLPWVKSSSREKGQKKKKKGEKFFCFLPFFFMAQVSLPGKETSKAFGT